MCPSAPNASPFSRCACVCISALVILLSSTAVAHVYGLEKSKVEEQLDIPTAHTDQIVWMPHLKLLRKEMKNCVKLTKDTTWNCFKHSSTHIFDDIMSSNVIPIWHGVRLVRATQTPAERRQSANLVAANRETAYAASKSTANTYQRQDLQHLTWFDRLALSLAKTLTTHVLQINLRELADAFMIAVERQSEYNELFKQRAIRLSGYSPIGNSSGVQVADQLGTARHRRHRYNMMITMMFGVTALGAVLVPMGFQMLSVVSGKALLLAKMALLLASINGLKKVANSGIHYGLYHVPGEHYGGYYDRGDATHHPRHVASIAVAEPFTEELGLSR